MKKSFILLGLAGLPFLTIVGCRSSRPDTSSPSPSPADWQQQPLVIDGSDKDWGRPLDHTIKQENLSYSVTNDGQNLYIRIATADPTEQQRIIGGMTVWINNKGDKTNGDAMGIGYPLDTRNDREHNLMAEAQPQRYKNDKPITLEDKKSYELYGFNKDSSIASYTYGDDNPQGVVMQLDYNDNRVLIYEAAIPLKDIYPHYNTSSSYAGKPIAVGIFVEGLPPGSRVPRQSGGGGPSFGVGTGLGMGSFGGFGGVGVGIGTGSLIGGGRRRNTQALDESQIWHVGEIARK